MLRGRGLRVDLREVASAPDDVPFDAYVIGSAVYAGHWLKRIKQYVHDNREVLLSHRVWLFSSGPIGHPPSRTSRRSISPSSWLMPPRGIT